MAVSVWQILIILVLLPLLFLPSIIALTRNHPYKLAIVLINIFGLALWGLGWIIAMVWCFVLPSNRTDDSSGVADEIQKLYELKEKGAITEAEFEAKKTALL
jgi:hypothetical protein